MPANIDFSKLTDAGCKLCIVSVNRLAELQQEILRLQDKGELDEKFAAKYLPRFIFSPPAELKNAKSIIVVAMPRPPTKAVFNWHGKKQTFILPPTYTAYDETRVYVERLVAEAVAKRGYRTATPQLPLKLLAVRSGLAEYGRCNIAFARGMGSFMRLTAVYSDLSCERDSWQEAKAMDRCANCDLCQKACPTGAIALDRFLLHAERCLTYHNEMPTETPFPTWIKPEWHNCIVGCIRCQAACPENKPYLSRMGETAEFTRAETKLLLAGTPREQIPQGTAEKMQRLSLTDYYTELPRNLSVLLK